MKVESNPDKITAKSRNSKTNKLAVSRNKIYNSKDWCHNNSEIIKHLGGKAANLRRLEDLGYNVPSFHVVSPEVLNTLIDQVQLDTIAQNREEMNLLFEKLISDKVALKALDSAIGVGALTSKHYAVRSSAIEEDGQSLSYAGQFDSYLNITPKDISKHVVKVWKSAYSTRVAAYKNINSIHSEHIMPCVIIQEMVDAQKAGVAFSAHPVSQDKDTILINSVNGLADKLVEGKINSSTYCMKNGQVEKSENEIHGNLSKWQLKKLAKTVKSIEKDFNHPQDIEWAFSANQLFILQSRDITTLSLSQEKDKGQNSNGEKIGIENKNADRIDIWDNSNIGESYPGVTTPMTFSFARNAYKNVYLQFCLLMGVSKDTIEKNSEIFPQMLGYRKGRIYYNLLNWYRLLMLFPGYKTNKQFMEQMMGLGEKVNSRDLDNKSNKVPSFKERVFDQVNTTVSMFGLLMQFAMLQKTTRLFNERLNSALIRLPSNLDRLSIQELVGIYSNLEKELLTKWDAPIVNDFFAMIFYGLLKKLSSNWIGEEGVHNQLLCGETGIISTEPARLLEEMAQLVRSDKNLSGMLENYQLGDNLDTFKSNDLFYNKLSNYLNKFGDRSPGELKLETKSLIEDPRTVLSAILSLSRRSADKAGTRVDAGEQRAQAEILVRKKLQSSLPRQIIFGLVLHQARKRIKERENLRFERTRVFGAVRKIFSQIGAVMEKNQILEQKEDIFFLEVEEVVRHHYGTSTTDDLIGLVSLRKNEYAKYKSEAAPPDRIRTVNGKVDNLAYTNETNENPSSTRLELSGTGCCPGKVVGVAKVILDPQSDSMKGFDILVAQRTDPGWITVISQAKAIVVEYGSLLSHTAIVARELGIPTIVAATGATTKINSGDLVEVNGKTGVVRITNKIENSTIESELVTRGTPTHVA